MEYSHAVWLSNFYKLEVTPERQEISCIDYEMDLSPFADGDHGFVSRCGKLFWALLIVWGRGMWKSRYYWEDEMGWYC